MDTSSLMKHMLFDVFGERNEERAADMAAKIFTEDIVFADQEGSVSGIPAILGKVAAILADAPGFEFALAAGPFESGTIGFTEWTFGPGGQAIVNGRDIVVVRDGLIAEIHTIVMPPAA